MTSLSVNHSDPAPRGNTQGTREILPTRDQVWLFWERLESGWEIDRMNGWTVQVTAATLVYGPGVNPPRHLLFFQKWCGRECKSGVVEIPTDIWDYDPELGRIRVRTLERANQ